MARAATQVHRHTTAPGSGPAVRAEPTAASPLSRDRWSHGCLSTATFDRAIRASFEAVGIVLRWMGTIGRRVLAVIGSRWPIRTWSGWNLPNIGSNAGVSVNTSLFRVWIVRGYPEFASRLT